MALTQGAVNVIKSSVQAAKVLLMDEFKAQLQQFYGIRPDGNCLLVEELTSRDAAVIETARLLRQRLTYLEEGIAEKEKAAEAVRQLVREQAFTILNRFAAIRMAEERNIIRETIKKGYNSEGFQVYDQLTGGAKTADQFLRYTWYIKGVFDELAIDLPAVFDRFSPYALLFPSEKVVLDLLEIINKEELSMYREPGHQPVNLWTEDETIGWIYQYYNSREEISEMRDASGAPRNSRELAVRNQFFTPRYVVQFLVDNSLGRQWYEMTKGQTSLTNTCEYLVKREQEIFIGKGEEMPEARIEGAHYVEHRQLKDPRAISMLDPACGSMHFGLYCFDLFEQIYIEAWDNNSGLMQDLREQYLREDFLKQIPSFILKYNIHGVDIDPRAIQIAGLSLWLRAQKTYDNLNLQPAERPAISKSNLVVAEPLPGNENILKDFTSKLPGPIGKLVRVIWDKMKLAGETGLLLKIEEELKQEIEIAKQEWENYNNSSAQVALFDAPEDSKAAEMAAIYGKGQKITRGFFDKAEEQVLKALESFAENAEGEDAFQKLLFAEDTARGFAFIELCRKKYDVIFQNPPFGAASENTKSYIDYNYPLSKKDLASVFVERMLELLEQNGKLGTITTRTIFFLGSYTNWRVSQLLDNNFIQLFADLGGGVLDAMVETATYVISKGNSKEESIFYKVTKTESKEKYLQGLTKTSTGSDSFIIDTQKFRNVSNIPFCYWVDNKTLDYFSENKKFHQNQRAVRQGLGLSDSFRYCRLQWEIDPNRLATDRNETFSGKSWVKFINTPTSLRYYYDSYFCLWWEQDGHEIKRATEVQYGSYTKRVCGEENYFQEGLSWAYRTAKFQPHIVPTGEIYTTARFLTTFPSNKELLAVASLWNSEYVEYCLKLSMEKDYQPKFISGTVNQLPHPFLKEEINKKLEKFSVKQYYRVKEIFRDDERSLAFTSNSFSKFSSLKDYAKERCNELKLTSVEYVQDLETLNQTVYDMISIPKEEQEVIEEIVTKAGEENEGRIFNLSEGQIIKRVFSILVGCVFGRWDMRILKLWNPAWSDENLFKARKHSPFFNLSTISKKSLLDLVLPEHQNEVKAILESSSNVEHLEECATIYGPSSIIEKFQQIVRYFWPETSDVVFEELRDEFKVSSIDEIFSKHSNFFNLHLKEYSRNRRTSPIYWHLGIPSGKFSLWIYYPGLNANSLYKVVNELVEPRIREVREEIEVLEMNSSSKELNTQKQLRDELLDFKQELLRVAQLPYRPNQDDGVLITAAPLHNLFQHNKWKKSTQSTWRKLEKGEYDWTHLAYSIWPERVQKKAKRDVSIAIAHDLEDICEIKPKETKKKKRPEVKKENQMKIN